MAHFSASSSALHNTPQRSASLLTQPLPNKPTNPPARLTILLPQITPDPSPHIRDLRECISRRRTTGIQRREPNAKADVLDVAVLDEVCVVRGWQGRVDEQFQQGFAGQRPAALAVAVDEGLAGREGVCERHDCCFAVVGPREFLRFGEDYCCVDWGEDAMG